MEKYINLSINKSETNSNWMKRPFSNNQLKYASEDVEFLIDIYTKQNKLLGKKGKLNKAFYLSKEEAARLQFHQRSEMGTVGQCSAPIGNI